jgi:uncharacterized membrane protein YhfC
MAVSAVISIGLPILLLIVSMKKFGAKGVPFILGAAVFIVFSLILEQGLHSVALKPDGIIRNNAALFVLYGTLAAGVFEETGRFIAFHFLKRKNYSGVANALSYGAGHGGIEAILLAGLTMISNIVLSVIANLGLTSVLGSVPQLDEAINTFATVNPALFLVGGLERIFAITIHISLSVIVWHSVMSEKVWLFPIAILLHAAIDVPAALAQAGVFSNIVIIEVLVAISAVVLAATAFAVNRTFSKPEEISEN